MVRMLLAALAASVCAFSTASAVELTQFGRQSVAPGGPPGWFAVVAADRRLFAPDSPAPTAEAALQAALDACERAVPGQCWTENGHAVAFPANVPSTIAVVFCKVSAGYYGTFPGGARIGDEETAKRNALLNARKGGYDPRNCGHLYFVDVFPKEDIPPYREDLE